MEGQCMWGQLRSFYYMYYVTHSVIILIVRLNARLGSSNRRSQRIGVRQDLARTAPALAWRTCVAPWRPSTLDCLKQGLDSQYTCLTYSSLSTNPHVLSYVPMRQVRPGWPSRWYCCCHRRPPESAVDSRP